MAYKITQHRRGTYDEWLELDVIPSEGELVIVEFDNNICKCKIGDGKKHFSELPYITDWLTEELTDVIDTLRVDINSELSSKVTGIYQRIEEAITTAVSDTNTLRADINTKVASLCSDINKLSNDIDAVDGVVKALVTPAVGALDAKYSEELDRIVEQHATDKSMLEAAINTSVDDLATTVDSKLSQTTSQLMQAIEDKSTVLAEDYTSKIDTVDERASDAILELERSRDQQATTIETLQTAITELSDSIDSRLDEKISESEANTETSLAEIRTAIGQVYIALDELKTGTPEELPDFDVGPDKVIDNVVLEQIIDQLDVIQYKVAVLESNTVVSTTDIQKLNLELARLATSLADTIEQQKAGLASIGKTVNDLDIRLNKADTDIVASIAAHTIDIDDKLAKLTAEDLLQYQRILKVQSDLIKKLDTASSDIRAELEADIVRINQNAADTKDKLNTRITTLQTNTINTIDSAKAELTKKLDNLDKVINAKITANTTAITTLNTVVAANQANISNELSELRTNIANNTTNIASNSSGINSIASELATKTTLLEASVATLGSRIDNKVLDIETRLQSQITAADSVIQEHTRKLTNVEDRVSDLAEDFDSTIDAKVTDAIADTNDSILVLISDIKKINSAIEQLQNGTGGTSIDSDSLLSIISQLAELKVTANSIDSRVSINKENLQKLNTELVALDGKLTSLINLHKDDVSNLTNSLSTMKTDLSNADAEIKRTFNSEVTNLKEDLADQAADYVLIFQSVCSVHDEVFKSLEALSAQLAKNLADESDEIYSKIEATKADLEKKLDEAQETLTSNTDTVQANLLKELRLVESRHGTYLTANTNAISELETKVKNDEASVTAKLNSITSDTAANKLAINNNAIAINNVGSNIQNSLDAITGDVATLNTKLLTQTTRIDSLISAKPDDLVPDENGFLSNETVQQLISELTDLRLGYDGLQHDSAGTAVRTLGEDFLDLKNKLPTYIPDNAVDGLRYEGNKLWLTSKGEQVGTSVEIVGGTGNTSSASAIVLTNNLATNYFKITKGSQFSIQFTYESFENSLPTVGIGTYILSRDKDKRNILETGQVTHGEKTTIDITDYIDTTVTHEIFVHCADMYGTEKYIKYTIEVIELAIEPYNFNSAQQFDSAITFSYKVFGENISKNVHILIDDNEIYTKSYADSVHNKSDSYIIPKQSHGCHKLTAYLTATINNLPIQSTKFECELICIDNNDDNSKDVAILASTYNVMKAVQGTLLRIPYMIYDRNQLTCLVNLNVYSKIGEDYVKMTEYCTTQNASRTQMYWELRKYPVGDIIFEISYTYTLHGIQTTINREHNVMITASDVIVDPESDLLQLYLHADGRRNDEENPAVWTFKPADEYIGSDDYPEVNTEFKNFNWKSNGWLKDSRGITCLRLNGDARAVINFKPFAKDFKPSGKTIEFEFLVRDVNSRDAIVIDCQNSYNDNNEPIITNTVGFTATSDTALFKSSGTQLECRYKDNEVVRVAISVDSINTLERFVSIYLDGILSGVKRYATSENFEQDPAVNITLGSSLCGLDLYSVRVYNKSLTAAEVLNNYIADQVDSTIKEQLLTDNDILYKASDIVQYKNGKAITAQEANMVGKISYDKVKALGKIPIVTFTGDMPKYKGDKRTDVYMKFEDPDNSSLNFDLLLDSIDVQGTSSQYYARKNWKIKLPTAKPHMPGAIPAKVYCIKVDYAEATGTHNTGTANYVETFYNKTGADSVILPPQQDDERVRTTIQGFPCIIFEKLTEDSVPVFSSKGNFNYDKGAEAVFGFTSDYDEFGVECWEFCNNTSNAVTFTGEIPAAWEDDFEPRYVPSSANYKRIEKLLEQRDEAAKGLATFTDSDAQELADLQAPCIANFKELHDWVRSTATYNLVGGERVDITPTPLEQEVVYNGITYYEDNKEYRLAKFKAEFTQYFNMHYTSIYYVYTFFALMTDQRAKNMFLTRWKDDDGTYKWYPYFYDNDTIFGINNEGALVFDYDREDSGDRGRIDSSSNVYNGQNSVLWNNFRECFPDEIKNTYSTLRSSGKLTYDKLIEYYVTNGSDKWSAAIYNEDAEYKYLSMARYEHSHKEDVTDQESETVFGTDTSNLYQVRGPGEHHLRYFVTNRLNYCDSKWSAGDYPSDFFFLRIYTPSTLIPLDTTLTDEELVQQYGEEEVRVYKSLKAVPPSPNINVKSFSSMYMSVQYKSGTPRYSYIAEGETYPFTPANAAEIDTFNDTETAIYGASSVASLGDLSKLYCGVVNLKGKNTDNSNATQGNVKENKLVELIIGSQNPNYYNKNFREIEVGTCRLLKKIDLSNCYGLGIAGSQQKTLDLTGCPNIEEIYLKGTNLTTVDLPKSGYIKHLHLPASTETVYIKDHKYLSDLDIESYNNIKTLFIENCDNLDTEELLNHCKNNDTFTVERVHFTGISWNFDTAEPLKKLFAQYDYNGNFISGIRGVEEKIAENGTTYLSNTTDAYLSGTCTIASLSGEEYAEIKQHYPLLDIQFGTMTSRVTFEYQNAAGEKVTRTHDILSENSEKGIITKEILDSLNLAPAWPENDAFEYVHDEWTYNGIFENKLGSWSYVEQTAAYEEQITSGEIIGDHENDYITYRRADALIDIAGDRTLYPVFKAIRKCYTVTFINPTVTDTESPEYSIIVENVPYGSTAECPWPVDTILNRSVAEPSIYAFNGWGGSNENIICDTTCYAQFIHAAAPELVLQDITGPGLLNEFGQELAGDGYTLFTNPNTMSINACKHVLNASLTVPSSMRIGNNDYAVTALGGLYNQNDYIDTITGQVLPALARIILPNTLLTLRQSAFKNCQKLSEVTLPTALYSIGSECFRDCKALTEINIPSSVEVIGDSAFTGCTNLQSFDLDPAQSKFLVESCCLIDKANKKIIFGQFLDGVAIPSSSDVATTLGSYCFAGNTKVTDLEIPENIQSVDQNAFYKCESLTSINFKNATTTIGSTCFSGCINLVNVTLPASVQVIPTYAFNKCKLATLTIPATITRLMDHAFGELIGTIVTFATGTDISAVIFDVASGKEPFTGSTNITFNCPWSSSTHEAKFGADYTKWGWGAKGVTYNFTETTADAINTTKIEITTNNKVYFTFTSTNCTLEAYEAEHGINYTLWAPNTDSAIFNFSDGNKVEITAENNIYVNGILQEA